MAGVRIGRVDSIRFNPKDYKADVVHAYRRSILGDSRGQRREHPDAGLLGGKYIGIGPGGSETFLKDGSQIEFTQSAIVLESLVNKFFANMASKGSDDSKRAPAGTRERNQEQK